MRKTVQMRIDVQSRLPDFEKAAQAAPQMLVNNLRSGMHSANQQVIARTVRKRFTGKGPFPAAENKLGVPPPIKILPIVRSSALSPSSAMSARSAAT